MICVPFFIKIFFWSCCSLLALTGCASDSTNPDAGGGLDDGGGRNESSVVITEVGPDQSSCIDTSSDPKNCGQCGHDCEQGLCLKGVCQPFVLFLVGNDNGVGSFGLSSSRVYFNYSDLNENGLSEYHDSWVDKKGGQAHQILGIRQYNEYFFPNVIQITGEYLYALDRLKGLLRVTLEGQDSKELLGPFGTDIGLGLAVGAEHIYFTMDDNGNDANHKGLRRIPLSGGPIETLTSDQPASGSVLDEQYLYWLEPIPNKCQVKRLDLSDDSIEMIATFQNEYIPDQPGWWPCLSIAQTPDHLFLPIGNKLWKIVKSNKEFSLLTETSTTIYDVAADNRFVYFITESASDNHQIWRMAHGSSSCELVYSSHDKITDLAGDDQALYFSLFDSSYNDWGIEIEPNDGLWKVINPPVVE